MGSSDGALASKAALSPLFISPTDQMLSLFIGL